METIKEHSPFATLRQKDLEKILRSNPDLGPLLQNALDDESVTFCDNHADQDEEALAAWRLHAALFSVMLEQLTTIYKRANDAAAAEAFYIEGGSELEFAFRGEARDAYVWLQCALSEDLEDACPTCTTTNILLTDTSIRVVMTSALFSTSSQTPGNFKPILSALQTALDNDPFWTQAHYPHLLSLSRHLAKCLKDLHRQTLELDIMLTNPPSSDGSVSSVDSKDGWPVDVGQRERKNSAGGDEGLIAMKMSRLAIRQLKMREEQKLEKKKQDKERREKKSASSKKGTGLLMTRNKSSSSLLSLKAR